MKIIVSEIPEGGLDVELHDRVTADAAKIVSPVHATLRFDRQESDVIVTGAVEGDVELQCSRCLKVFSATISSRTDLVYHPFSFIRDAEDGQLKGDELDTTFYKNDVIDTDDLLAEQIVLNLPMKSLCSPECKGFCPQCGADLSVQGCSCGAAETDPRLAVLKQLLPKKE
ncbi:MAG: hypothetical protein FD164_1949 [Nitrospirae bacterium]|nr:MAG: hypothetical protein FD164_1949 [Nitrospirota bacterium]